MPRSLAASLTLAFALASSRPVYGQAALSAKDHVRLGDRLQRIHLYDEAAAEYQQAMSLSGASSTLRRLAEAKRAAGDLSGAVEAFELLAVAPDASREEKGVADKALRGLTAESGLIIVRTDTEQASLFVDGQRLGTTPFRKPLRLPVGSHVVYFEKEGFEPFSSTVEVVSSGPTVVSAVLRPARVNGLVSVTEAKLRSFVFRVDGTPVGKTPYSGELPPGDHTFELADPKFGAPSISTKVVQGARTTVVLQAAELFGTLRLKIDPPDARISVDDTPVTITDREIELPVGQHRVQAMAAGYATMTETFQVFGGKPSTWSASLSRVVDKPSEKPDDEEASTDAAGGHFDLELAGAFPLHDRVDTCPQDKTQHACTTGASLGGGLLLRGGYNFDPIGLEFTGFFFGGTTTSSTVYNGGGAPTDPAEAQLSNVHEYRISHVGGIAALGPSVSSRGTTVRFIGGIAGGFSARNIALDRDVSGGVSDSTSAANVVFGPAGIANVGILLGSTPGTKFTFSLLVALEKLDFSTPADTRPFGRFSTTVPSYPVLTGLQYYIGPSLGLRFGH